METKLTSPQPPRSRTQLLGLGRLLALVGLSGLILEAATLPVVGRHPGLIYAIVVAGLALAAGITFDLHLTNALIAVGGVLLLVTRAGASAVVVLAVLLALLGWLTGLLGRLRR